MSHPAWVCGLKQSFPVGKTFGLVTPCVGVWIETIAGKGVGSNSGVTPCVGVWIETRNTDILKDVPYCHTLRGCVD